MLLEPRDSRAGVHAPQVHHQVDRSATAFVAVPVEELGARYRKRTTFGAPLSSVSPVTFRAPVRQHRFQRDRADLVGLSTEVFQRHGTLLVELVAQALTVLHVDNVTGLGQSIEQGGR